MADPTSQPPAVESKKTATLFHWLFAFLLAAAFILEMVSFFRPLDFAGWLDAAFILLATVSTLASLWRQLPLQNVLLAALVAAVIGGGFSAVGAKTGLPFGPFMYGSEIGPKILNLLPCVMPLVWVVVIFNSRGLGRLILRPWRKNKDYGLRLIALTGLLVLLFDMALEPYAFRVKHYWNWMPTSFPFTWQRATPVNFLAWALIAVLILLFASPALIVKRPRSKGGPHYHPLCLWLGGLLLCGTGCALNGIWPPVVADAVMGIAVTIFAVRGAMW